DLANRLSALDFIGSLRVFFERFTGLNLRPKSIQRLSDFGSRQINSGLALTSLRFLKALVWDANEEHSRLVQHRLDERIFNAGFITRGQKIHKLGRCRELGRTHVPAFEIYSEIEGFGPIWMELVPVKGCAHARQHQDN